MKFIRNIAASVLCAAALVGCTDLDETLYDQVGTQNYYNTKSDVIRAVFRPFEHAYWSIQSRHVLNELTADQLITPTRDDGGMMVANGVAFTIISGTLRTEVMHRPSGTAVFRV